MSDTHDIEMRAWADLAQRLQRELSEARAALLSARSLLVLAADWSRFFDEKHAAAIKAAQEDKP